MRYIVSAIYLLAVYLEALKTNPEQFRPAACPHCGHAGVWCHGHYGRKSDYENSGARSLNPIPILRFYCKHCCRTCSTLPECIPARRHYPWLIQQGVMVSLISGMSFTKISKKAKPSRWTIARWFNRWQAQFLDHASHLRTLLPSLGQITDFNNFWKSVLNKWALSSAMLRLHYAGIIVP